ncbi:hypothetical protein [Foetidibacter luteolus]|uniref:hypothetical protein n=1 Tax=Foetidibacter luteolus TaxID=2608880 RepID=UPI00129B2D4B|nr:hypothetical protein [Foetidibacter luteolus]
MAKVELMHILVPVLLLLVVVLFLFSYRKDRPVYQLFKEAQHCEDNGEFMAAIEIYELILEQYRQLKFKDGQMIKHVIRKLKQLRTKHGPDMPVASTNQGARLFIKG